MSINQINPKSPFIFYSQNLVKSLKTLSSFLILSSKLGSKATADSVTDTSENIISNETSNIIDLNRNFPNITDICWLDISIDGSRPKRVEISLFGDITPVTSTNFKALCLGLDGFGYKDSEIFRIISNFSVQAGNIGNPKDIPISKLSRYGKAVKPETIISLNSKIDFSTVNRLFNGNAFMAENYKIKHDYSNAGVVSMMKDVTNKGLQDSRFFISLSSKSSWADNKYVAFGIVSKGMNVINEISQIDVIPPSNYPSVNVKIVDSGCYSNPTDINSIVISRFISFHDYIHLYN